ncbi:MAG: hypothetical protein RMJ07_04420 [Nitrososphaerota archaeon]|nr:hypothetical protein [Candidatus Bathyarchaeota archaeon]MDW8048908.1 hypothetical protein [Nitrososphaerota archaeon]
MNEKSSSVEKVSAFFIAIIAVLLALSIFSLFQAFEIYRRTGLPDFLAIFLSISAIILSFYMVFQLKSRPIKLGFEIPKVFTNIQCRSCEFRQVREFQKGDYIFRQMDPCPKCNSPTYVSSIFREPEEKEE